MFWNVSENKKKVFKYCDNNTSYIFKKYLPIVISLAIEFSVSGVAGMRQ